MPGYIEVTPERWSHTGEAEIRRGSRTLRIWSGIPDELCRAKLQYEGEHQSTANWREAHKAHPNRVEPRCEKYHTCGGCPLMHLDPDGQARARRWLVRDALAEQGLSEVEVGEVVPSPDGADDFRHVIKLGIGYSDQGALRVGAWGRRSRTIVPIPNCNVAAPKLRYVMGTIAHWVRKLDLRPFDFDSNKGILRAIVLRSSRATGEVVVTIAAAKRIRALDELAEQIVVNAREVKGVVLHLNDEPGNAIFAHDENGAVPYTVLVGQPVLEDSLNGISYTIGPGEFFQTNPGMAEVLYQETIDRLGLQLGEPVLDLYCGVGGFALPAARRTGWALGVEEIAGAVETAKDAARRNSVPAEFMAGKVNEVLEQLRPRLADVRPVIIVNPARRGLEDGVIERILALKPRRLAYISCNPRALARDLVQLRAGGLEIGPVALYDMFPNTAHIESVALLRAPDAEGLVRRAPRRVKAR